MFTLHDRSIGDSLNGRREAVSAFDGDIGIGLGDVHNTCCIAGGKDGWEAGVTSNSGELTTATARTESVKGAVE